MGRIFLRHPAQAELEVVAQALVQSSSNTSTDRCSIHSLDSSFSVWPFSRLKTNKPKPKQPYLSLNQLVSIASHLTVAHLQEEPGSLPSHPPHCDLPFLHLLLRLNKPTSLFLLECHVLQPPNHLASLTGATQRGRVTPLACCTSAPFTNSAHNVAVLRCNSTLRLILIMWSTTTQRSFSARLLSIKSSRSLFQSSGYSIPDAGLSCFLCWNLRGSCQSISIPSRSLWVEALSSLPTTLLRKIKNTALNFSFLTR